MLMMIENAPEIPLPKPFFKFTVGSQGKFRKPSVHFAAMPAVQVYLLVCDSVL